MNKTAPGFGRDRRDGGLRAVLLRPAAVPLAGLRRPVPLKPKGYRFHVDVPEATTLAKEADVRISGVPVGKVKDDPARQADRPSRTSRSSCSRSTCRCAGRAGDPAPEDAAGRDLRRADAGLEVRAGRCPRAGSLPAAPGLEDGRARRDPAHLRPEDARAFQEWMQEQALAIDRPRARRQRRARQPRPVRRGRRPARRHPQPPAAARALAHLQHRRRLRRADRARRPAALADRELQQGVRDHRGARPASCRRRSSRCRRSSASRARRSIRLTAVRRNAEPARHPAAAGRARAVARRCSDLALLAPDLKLFVRGSTR